MRLCTLILVVFAGTTGCGPADSDFVEFRTWVSSDDYYRVMVMTAPKSKLAFASVIVRFYLSTGESNEHTLLATRTLANDGAGLTGDNISAEWIANSTLRACLSGAEQADEVVVIDAVTAVVNIQAGDCSG